MRDVYSGAVEHFLRKSAFTPVEQCQNTFWVVTTGTMPLASSRWSLGMLLNCLQSRECAITTKNLLVQNVDIVEDKKPVFKNFIYFHLFEKLRQRSSNS